MFIRVLLFVFIYGITYMAATDIVGENFVYRFLYS